MHSVVGQSCYNKPEKAKRNPSYPPKSTSSNSSGTPVSPVSPVSSYDEPCSPPSEGGAIKGGNNKEHQQKDGSVEPRNGKQRTRRHSYKERSFLQRILCLLRRLYGHEEEDAIIFGTSFIIRKDLSERMFFRCLDCQKDMNNVRSLTDHAYSGSHLKSTSTRTRHLSETDDVPELRDLRISFGENSLQEKIVMAAFPIIGLNRVEAFRKNPNGQWYYKCTTCGAHGNTEAMYYHLIGDKHTDRYIKSKVILKSSTITAEERTYIRSIISSKEEYSINNIKIMLGNEFYPQRWEDDGKNNFSLSKRKCKTEKSSIMGVNYCEEEQLLTPCKEEETADNDYFCALIGRFAKIAGLFMSKDSKGHSIERKEEFREALIVLSLALHWIFFTNEILMHESEMLNKKLYLHYANQRDVVTGCLGLVEKKLKKRFNEKYQEIALD